MVTPNEGTLGVDENIWLVYEMVDARATVISMLIKE